ncbi:MAG: hypothetical protein ACOC2E_06010 [Bacteroidota bacterium]
MRRITQVISTLLAFFFLHSFSYCQETAHALKSNRGNIVPENYDRISLSWMMAYSIYDPFLNDLKSSFAHIDHGNKFFKNEIDDAFIEIRNNREQGSSLNKESIASGLQEQNISRQIISHWYNRESNGKMNMDLVHERGLMNATDADVLRQELTKRGLRESMDYGNRLISKSYVVVLDFIETERTSNDHGGGYRVSVLAHVFKLNFTEEEKQMIYDSWIMENDSEEEVKRKNELFATISPQLKHVKKIEYFSESSSNTSYKKLSREQHFNAIAQEAADGTIFRIERDMDEFKVITSLYSAKPPAAKIGKKEGLKVDDRYFVYEHKYRPRTNTIKEVRRGVIRADAGIANNVTIATGATETSNFYQISGQKLREGYVIQQRNDWGFGLTVGQNTGGEMAGFNIGGDYSVGRYVEVPSFYLTANVAFEGKEGYGSEIQVLDASGFEKVSFFRFDVGIMKGYHFMRNFELNPYLAYGQESASIPGKDDEKSVYTNLIKTGAYLSLNITYFWEFIGGVNFNMPFGNAYEKDGDSDAVELEGIKYTDYFPGRRGMSFYYGIRIRF